MSFITENKLMVQCHLNGCNLGAYVMAENVNGLQMKIKEQVPQAILVNLLNSIKLN